MEYCGEPNTTKATTSLLTAVIGHNTSILRAFQIRVKAGWELRLSRIRK